MENFKALLQEMIKNGSMPDVEFTERGIVIPFYWCEDYSGNINFDLESMRGELEDVLSVLEEHNEESEFDWDKPENYFGV